MVLKSDFDLISTFYFLRYAQVKNQKAIKMFAYEEEKHKMLPTFQEKIKFQWQITKEFIRNVKFSEYYCYLMNTNM